MFMCNLHLPNFKYSIHFKIKAQIQQKDTDPLQTIKK